MDKLYPPRFARVFTPKAGCRSSRAVELLNDKWDVVEGRVRSLEDACPAHFTEMKCVSVYDMEEEMSVIAGAEGWEVCPGVVLVQAQWMLDGCSSLDDIIATLKQETLKFEQMKEEGYWWERKIEDDFGNLLIGFKTEEGEVPDIEIEALLPPVPPTAAVTATTGTATAVTTSTTRP
ncbi:hypothetical protein B484DRAFT_188150 [Ochromonadaceae sp. CCMP2298]|nr:hypothetical protein B484DRAFT_188150 [Ochromonadaceae sp. CCMP2298]|mmetsp:Transcript_3555/g.7674  ORF Transcript_3555/g.7674 Transcript_3555/m.7674 type:complete len:177 (-) Transcript_3555:1966-2496(-)